MRTRTARTAALTAAALIVLAACGSDDGGASDDAVGGATPPAAADTSGTAVERIEPSPPDVRFSGLSIGRTGVNADGAPAPLVDLDEIISGGPPPDGIPPIDAPNFITANAVDFLDDREPVLAVDINDDRRAYPVQILMWHEIVNDVVGGTPVAVTYCPLCNSAIAVDRRLDDRIFEFGTSGMLWNSALVMYDRQTESLWSHFTGQAIVGELTGTELLRLPVATVPWETWRDANPDGLVLSRDTGFDRDYGRNPYVGYDSVDNDPFLFQGEVDGRYTAMTRIVGFDVDGRAVGVPLVALRDRAVLPIDVDGRELVVWWRGGTASALDTASISEGVDIGSTGVFDPHVDPSTGELGGETALTFVPSTDGASSDAGDGDHDFIDEQTGSTWTVLGEAIDGPLAGTQLQALPHVDTFWFAWSTFQPDTLVIDQPASAGGDGS